jgi:hypothetical protein
VLRVPLPDRDVAGRRRSARRSRSALDALPGQILAGHVTRVGQSADARTGAVTVEIEVAARPDLRSGQIATARLASRVAANANGPTFARIPAEAVLEASGGKAAVLRLDNAKGEMRARRTPVRFGGFDGDDALVAGLPDGARVITAGAGFVSDGDRVTRDRSEGPGRGEGGRPVSASRSLSSSNAPPLQPSFLGLVARNPCFNQADGASAHGAPRATRSAEGQCGGTKGFLATSPRNDGRW